jgi:hypothetical protein
MREDFDATWHEFAEFRCMMACKQRQETLLLGRKLFKVKPQSIIPNEKFNETSVGFQGRQS